MSTLARGNERCVGCGATSACIAGPTHRYMTSSPGCWQRYGELLALLYVRPSDQATLVMCADTYAVQHPGSRNPQAIQSVTVHLLNLYAYLVLGQPVQRPQSTLSDLAFRAIADHDQRDSLWLAPPTFEGSLTVFDMPSGDREADLTRAARAWAESAWSAWEPHHAQVARWHSRFMTSTASR